MKGTIQGQHSFAQIPSAEIQRSSFNRSSGYKTTFDAGFLIPVFVDEALPGDTFNLRMSTFARLATPLHPILDNMYLDSHFFAVPMRLLWDNWNKFMGEQVDPGDSISFTIPQLTIGALGCGESNTCDYMGLPVQATNITTSVMPLRAYNLIYNEWFRDENLEDSATVPKTDGPDSLALYNLRPRSKRHDYFTSCLPWPQKGTSPPLIISGTVPVTAAGDKIPLFDVNSQTGQSLGNITATASTRWSGTHSSGSDLTAEWDDPKLEADLSTATANSINELRLAFQIQKLLERDARGGSRYTEIVRAHFGVSSPDQRLQRPEYLGGGTQNISITPVPQQSASADPPTTDDAQGNLAGYGTTTGSNHSFNKSFTEHCIIIGIVSVRADLTYQQGLNKMWSRLTKHDFYWPALAHIGEQAVLRKEIYERGDNGVPSTDSDIVFGYQERWAEYRYKPSLITGRFRSEHATPLDTWHLGQDFSPAPTLSAEFIKEKPPIDRIIAVTTEPHFLFDAYFDLKCARPMPTYSVPGMIDHF